MFLLPRNSWINTVHRKLTELWKLQKNEVQWHLLLSYLVFLFHLSLLNTVPLRCPFLTSTVVTAQHNYSLKIVKPLHSDTMSQTMLGHCQQVESNLCWQHITALPWTIIISLKQNGSQIRAEYVTTCIVNWQSSLLNKNEAAVTHKKQSSNCAPLSKLMVARSWTKAYLCQKRIPGVLEDEWETSATFHAFSLPQFLCSHSGEDKNMMLGLWIHRWEWYAQRIVETYGQTDGPVTQLQQSVKQGWFQENNNVQSKSEHKRN